MTHYAFAQVHVGDEVDRDVVFLGAQGPDVFFFYGYTLKRRPNVKAIQNFGTYLHHIDISSSYSFLLDDAHKKEGREREILLSFIRGLFLHYILDRNCHPYVFYRTGFAREEKDAKHFMASHAAFESHMDVLIADEYGISIAPIKAIEASSSKVALISRMFGRLASSMFKNEAIDEMSYYLAWKDMKFCERTFHSPLGIKKALFRAFFPEGQVNAMSAPRTILDDDILDILNEKRATWKDCVSGEERHESMNDLFRAATIEVGALDGILASGGSEASLKAFVRSIDHDGFAINATKKYFVSAWDLVPDHRW